MKKYHLYLWIVALVGLITSCSQDETDALPTDTNANRVTLTASLPADFVQPQPKSRAALPTAPADHKLRCILEVWDTEAAPSLKIRQEICPANGDTEIAFSFDLATAGKYKALLWADYISNNQGTTPQDIAGLTGVVSYGDKYYTTTNGLKEVEISTTLPIYPEEGDAFYTNTEFTKDEKALTIPTVTLTRPFMKLTIAEKNAERFASCNQVIARFNTLCKFDVATGNATGTRNYGLPAANGHRNYGNDITIGGKTCETLICLYLFANEADGTMGDIKLEFTSSDPNKSLPTVTIPAGIPLKRNYCVNAAGNLIGEPSSSTVNMTVDIKSDWTGTEEETTSATVAAYYYKNNTWSTENKTTNDNPIIGVVYKVNDDGTTGKVVSLTEGTNLKWGLTNVATEAKSTTSGKENTDKVFAVINNNPSYNLSDWPIFNACQEQRTNTGNDRWYVPRTLEYTALFKVRSTINDRITAISGTEVIAPTGDSDSYWTSEENSSAGAFYMKSDNGSTNTNKGDSKKVRFILDF